MAVRHKRTIVYVILSTMLEFAVPHQAAKAETISLSCDGEMRVVSRDVTENTKMALIIENGNVQVGNWGRSAITSQLSSDSLVFGERISPSFGAPTGSINRITGSASVYIMTLTDGIYRFFGSCKKAEKLF